MNDFPLAGPGPTFIVGGAGIEPAGARRLTVRVHRSGMHEENAPVPEADGRAAPSRGMVKFGTAQCDLFRSLLENGELTPQRWRCTGLWCRRIQQVLNLPHI